MFWGGDIVQTYKSAAKGVYNDRHHEHMVKHYKETPWLWYVGVLVFSFVLGIITVTKENITLPVWAYIVSLLLGILIAPFVSIPKLSGYRASSNISPVHPPILPLRKRYCHQQLVQDVGRSYAPRAPRWQYVLRCLVPQCHRKLRQPL